MQKKNQTGFRKLSSNKFFPSSEKNMIFMIKSTHINQFQLIILFLYPFSVEILKAKKYFHNHYIIEIYY